MLYSHARILHSLFHECQTDTGGAAAFMDSEVTLVDTNFCLNLAEEAGVAAFDLCGVSITGGVSWGNDALEVSVFEFVGCHGRIDGHIFCYNAGHLGETGGVHLHSSLISLYGCSFCHNHVEEGWAGAVTVDQANGTVVIEECDFLSNEVVGWKGTHIFASGSATVLVIKDCNFDTLLKEDAIMSMVEGPNLPNVSIIHSHFGAKIVNPLPDSIGNDSLSWEYKFEHGKSDLFAVLIFILVPAFIGAVTWCLTWD